jgi:hypothetical protein
MHVVKIVIHGIPNQSLLLEVVVIFFTMPLALVLVHTMTSTAYTPFPFVLAPQSPQAKPHTLPPSIYHSEMLFSHLGVKSSIYIKQQVLPMF